MPANNPDFASGASAARNKLANALAEMGIDIPCNDGPPQDDEYKVAIAIHPHGPIHGGPLGTRHEHGAR